MYHRRIERKQGGEEGLNDGGNSDGEKWRGEVCSLKIPSCLGLPESLDVGVEDKEGIEDDS